VRSIGPFLVKEDTFERLRIRARAERRRPKDEAAVLLERLLDRAELEIGEQPAVADPSIPHAPEVDA
jgi:hypothetical protein